MKILRALCLAASLAIAVGSTPIRAEERTLLVFAVVTEVPQDRREVSAQVFVDGQVNGAILQADKEILGNVMWQKLEMCHSLKAQALKTAEGYRIVSFKMLGPSMLPMPLQGVSGDCFLRKALEYAPLLE